MFFMTLLLNIIKLYYKTRIIVLMRKIGHRKMIIGLLLDMDTNSSFGSDVGYCSLSMTNYSKTSKADSHHFIKHCLVI
jgi:hypothetical protein